MFEVRVSVENPQGILLANMSANAEIILEQHENCLTVPEGAVIYGEDEKTFVEVPDIASETGKRRVDPDVGYDRDHYIVRRHFSLTWSVSRVGGLCNSDAGLGSRLLPIRLLPIIDELRPGF